MQTVWLLHLFLRKKNSVNEVINAVVIDDEANDVWAVTNALGIKGIATFPIHYSEANKAFDYCRGIASSQPRVIITDIQINRSAGRDPTTTDYANIASCIELLVSEISGPYIILAWTDQSSHLAELKDYVLKYLEKQNIILPFYFDAICKVECREDGSDTEYSMEKIFSKFSIHMEQKKGIRALMSWEKLVARSAHKTVDSLVSMAGDNLTDVLFSLGEKVAGQNLPTNECAALNESLFYVLRDELAKASEVNNNQDLWSKALEGGVLDNTKNLKNQLNTLLHIDENIVSNTICPGDVWLINNEKSYFSTFSTGDELETQLDAFKNICISDNNRVISIKKHISDEKKESKVTELHKKLHALVTELIDAKSASLIVAVEISPQCDFSNKKKPLKSIVLGMLVPQSKLSKKVTVSQKQSETSLPIHFNDIDYDLVISAKYILSSSPEQIGSDDISFSKIFRIRESMLQSWIQFISSYNARIGTISFH
jgi:hypothetical protein